MSDLPCTIVDPVHLFGPAAESGGDEDLNAWCVVHTRPRAEKALGRWLANRELCFYLPLYERSYVAQRRVVRSFLPLFPGYVFLRGGETAREAACRFHQVVRCLSVVDQERLGEDLRRIQGLIDSGAPLAPEARLERGMPAEIIRGPLAGPGVSLSRSASGCGL